MVESKELKVEHVLMFVIVAFLLYHLVGNCGCTNRGDGFSVGNQSTNDTCISQGTNSIPFNCDSASGIIKYNASKIVCLNNKCTFNTCCDKINTSCTEALNELCQYDIDATFKSDCIQCVGHDNPLKLHKAGCLHNDLVDYCQDQPGRETRDLITPGFYKTGISMNDPSGWLPKLIGDFNICKSKPCPKGSAFYENTKEGCLFSTDIDKYLIPLIGPIVNNRNTCKLDKTIQSTDEVIDVRSLKLGYIIDNIFQINYYMLDMSYCDLDPGANPAGSCYDGNDCVPGCTAKIHNNDGIICKNIKNMGKVQGYGKWYRYSNTDMKGEGTIIGPTDPKLDILNMLFCSFNISRIGVSHSNILDDNYTIEFITDNANANGKHYNYTFIDNTGDNYDTQTSYYSGTMRQQDYSSESPQINYIIKS